MMKTVNSLIPKAILLCFVSILIVSCKNDPATTVPISIIIPTINIPVTASTFTPGQEILTTDVPVLSPEPGVSEVPSNHPTILKIDFDVIYDCTDTGAVTRAEVLVYPSGGVEPYIVSPAGEIHAKPGDFIPIEVFSNTPNREPHNKVTIRIESNVKVSECRNVNNLPGATHSSPTRSVAVPTTTSGSIVPTTPPEVVPTTPPNVIPTTPPVIIPTTPANTCNDGVDNDSDGYIDGADKGCKNKHDTVED